jgi:hypothetical protein
MWNICDTSRLRISNVTINNHNPEIECINNQWHGPTGRWYNGAACDYYGKYGYASMNKYHINTFYNNGIFRVLIGDRGILKSLYEHEYKSSGLVPWHPDMHQPLSAQLDGGGSPLDQVNAQGYQTIFDIASSLSGADITSALIAGEDDSSGLSGLEYVFGGGLAGSFQQPGKMNGLWQRASMTEGNLMKWGYGELHPAFATPPLHMKWEGYLDNILDESAASLFANARHAANKKSGMVSIYRSNVWPTNGGEGRDSDSNTNPFDLTFGLGVKSLNIFELTQLV